MRFMILTAVIATFGLTLNASPVWAAKGAKKNAGEHVVEGVIVSVQAANNGQGSFVLHVHHKKQPGNNPNAAAAAGKAGAAAQGAGQAGKGAGKGKGHTINVNQNTKFEGGAGGKGAQQASFANLKAGEHVTVNLKGKTAEVVKIHHHGKGQKKA